MLYRVEGRDGKPTKVPYCATDPTRRARSTDPSTWTTFDEATAASSRADGIGFAFSPEDPFVGIDLDDCIDEHGEIEPWAAEIVERLDSYAERSPSGRGLHVIVAAKLTGSRRRSGDFEVYDRGRYFTVTGQRIGERETVEGRQDQLDALLAEVFPPEPPAPSVNGSAPRVEALPDDRDLLDRAFAAKNGAKVEALYRGEVNGYGSPSEADLALCGLLAFWAGPDPARIDRLFRSSGLVREKWDSPRGDSTYGAQTVEKALSGRTEFYEPGAEEPSVEEAEQPRRRETPREFRDADGNTVVLKEPLQQARNRLNLPDLNRVVKRSRNDSTYAIELGDGTVIEVGSSRDLMDPRKVEAAVADATGVAIPYYAGKTFRPVAAALLAIAELEDTGAGIDDVTRGWLRRFYGKLGFTADDPVVGGRAFDLEDPADRAEVVGAKGYDADLRLCEGLDAFRDTGRALYVHLERFEHYMRHIERVPTSQRDLTRRLHRLGFEWQRVYAPRQGQSKTPPSRAFWRSPPHFALEEKGPGR